MLGSIISFALTSSKKEDRVILPALSTPTGTIASNAAHAALEITGGHPLNGHVCVSGAKNSALVIMAGALLCADECRIHNVPDLADVNSLGAILTAIGVKVSRDAENALVIDARNLGNEQAPYELVSQLRASFFAIGAILARQGVARIPLPGGCAIGARPVDLHVRGLKALGAHVVIEHGMVEATVPGAGRLKGAKIYLDCPSVGATETLMMAATLAEGETIIQNAAQEPEVVDLANFCQAMGARIKGAGTNTIVIDGVPSLHGTEWTVIPDRIEAGSFLIAGAITRSSITVGPVAPDHLTAVIAKLQAIGCGVLQDEPRLLRTVPGAVYRGIDLKTMPFPGFPTDMQAQFMALLTLADGNSVVTETMFENRLQHVAELRRMGANIRTEGNTAVIHGVPFLSGAPVMATDLRASAALVLAGLAAQGTTLVQNLKHLDRGYERLDAKLMGLGAQIRRVEAAVNPED